MCVQTVPLNNLPVDLTEKMHFGVRAIDTRGVMRHSFVQRPRLFIAARVSWHLNLQSYSRADLRDGPVRTPAADEEQASKAVEGLVVVVWEHLLLWGVLIKPCFPLFLMVTDLKGIKKETVLTTLIINIYLIGKAKNQLHTSLIISCNYLYTVSL